MTLGPVMVDLEGLELTSEERTFLRQPAVGGVILFSRNYESPEQVRELIEQIHGLRNPSLLVAVATSSSMAESSRERSRLSSLARSMIDCAILAISPC